MKSVVCSPKTGHIKLRNACEIAHMFPLHNDVQSTWCIQVVKQSNLLFKTGISGHLMITTFKAKLFKNRQAIGSSPESSKRAVKSMTLKLISYSAELFCFVQPIYFSIAIISSSMSWIDAPSWNIRKQYLSSEIDHENKNSSDLLFLKMKICLYSLNICVCSIRQL